MHPLLIFAMVTEGETACPICGGELKYYDQVLRILRTKNGKTEWLKLKRYRCTTCGRIHRALPDNVLPYKQYDAEIIRGVLEGLITSETLGYEDYPCERTMERWKGSLNSHSI